MGVDKKVLSLARLGEKGRLTIPAEHRQTHRLGRDSAPVMVEIGDTLVPIPYDEELAAVTARLEAALKGAGSDTDDLIKAVGETLTEIAGEELGDADGRAVMLGARN